MIRSLLNLFTLNPQPEEIAEKSIDTGRRFSSEFEALLEKYRKDGKL